MSDEKYAEFLKKGAEDNKNLSKETYLENIKNENFSVGENYSFLGNIVTLLGGFSILSIDTLTTGFQKKLFILYIFLLIVSAIFGYVGRYRILRMWTKSRRINAENFSNWNEAFPLVAHATDASKAEEKFTEAFQKDRCLQSKTDPEIAEWPMWGQIISLVLAVSLLLVLIFAILF